MGSFKIILSVILLVFLLGLCLGVFIGRTITTQEIHKYYEGELRRALNQPPIKGFNLTPILFNISRE